jgi:hypothetical protein
MFNFANQIAFTFEIFANVPSLPKLTTGYLLLSLSSAPDTDPNSPHCGQTRSAALAIAKALIGLSQHWVSCRGTCGKLFAWSSDSARILLSVFSGLPVAAAPSKQ